jgi:hypothetical protein
MSGPTNRRNLSPTRYTSVCFAGSCPPARWQPLTTAATDVDRPRDPRDAHRVQAGVEA